MAGGRKALDAVAIATNAADKESLDCQRGTPLEPLRQGHDSRLPQSRPRSSKLEARKLSAKDNLVRRTSLGP